MQGEQERWGKFWQDTKVRKHVAEQVKAAGLAFYRITKHDVYFSRQLQIGLQEVEGGGVMVLVGLGKGFPLTPPQVHFATSFSKPSLKDYRDILVQLIGESWHWEVTIAQVIDKVPKFIRRLVSMKGEGRVIQRLGEFHAHKYYDYSLLKELSQHNPYICFENYEDKVTLLVISVTATHVIFFQPTAQPYFNEENKLIIPRETELTTMRLVLLAQLQSLTEVTHMRSSRNEYILQFTAFNLRKMEYTRREWRKALNITRSAQFMQSLIKQAWHFGVRVSIEVGGVKANSAEQALLCEAGRKEQKLKHYFNRDSLMDLIDSYQRLVEYYSAEGPPYQEVYVHKTAALYNRADVQLIINAYNSK